MKYTIYSLLFLLLLGCSKDYDRDPNPIILFNTTEYPLLDGYVVVDEQLTDQKLTFSYKDGQNRKVVLSAKEQMGLYIEEQTIQLAEEGTFSVTLNGKATQANIVTFITRISYGQYHFFVNKDIGIRPAIIDAPEIVVNPTMQGMLYGGLSATTCTFSFGYENGWSRKATIWFESTDAGLLDTKTIHQLALDGDAATLTVPLQGIPSAPGKVTITMLVEMEDKAVESFVFADIPVMEAVEYVEETVTHNIIITDRNDLMKPDAVFAYADFSYTTIFVDMNGDGYVSGNHEIWLDRNVGAVSTDSKSTDSYGFYYQPGRSAPGWVSNSHNVSSAYKGEKYQLNNTTWFNGTRTPVEVKTLDATGVVTIEAGKIGPNNPCPQGFRPPTGAEWSALYNYLGCTAAAHDVLRDGIMKLPFVGGHLDNTISKLVDVGVKGYYWAATFDNNQVPAIYFSASVANRPKGYALPVRCVKAKDSELASY